MKLNRKLILVLSLVLSVAMATTGTLAYLTDRDSIANVFTLGNVEIKLHETFGQGSTLIPGVNVEKKPTIENTGDTTAWVWATIAIPSTLDDDDASKNILHFNYAKENVVAGKWNWKNEAGAWNVEKNVVLEDGKAYNVYTVLYETALNPGDETEPVMTKVYFDPHLDIDPEGNICHVQNGEVYKSDWNIETMGNPTMYVSAYAIQAQEFDTVQEAYAAYNAQWGDKGTEYAKPGIPVSNAAGLTEALANSNTIYLTNDVEAGEQTIAAGTETEIKLQGYELNAALGNNGTLDINGGELNSDVWAVENTGTATITNVTMKAGSAAHYSNIAKGTDAESTYTNVDIDSAGGGIGAVNGAKVTFNSGNLAVNSPSTSGRYLFYTDGAGSEIVINGGTFSFSKTLNQKRAYIYAGADTTVTVNGGTFGPASTRSGYTAGIVGTGTVIIKGGTFGFDPSAWVAAGYVATKTDGVWTVTAE